MKKYTLEICVDSVESAINAERGKATRLELCSNLIIGGTTPTKSLFEEVKKNVDIPINVLIRPRFGDFLYSDYEVNIIKNEIKVGENDEIVKNYKIGGFTLEYAVKDKNEEKKNEVLSNLRKFILNSMINGKIKFYCSENEIVPYEENKVYIPEKFRNYIRTLIIGEGAGVVGIANSRNEIINDLNDVDVIVADILSEPKTEKEIIEKLSKTAIYRTMPDGERKEVEASEYLPESIRKFEFLGYFSKR